MSEETIVIIFTKEKEHFQNANKVVEVWQRGMHFTVLLEQILLDLTSSNIKAKGCRNIFQNNLSTLTQLTNY